jgi:hypothetical protein
MKVPAVAMPESDTMVSHCRLNVHGFETVILALVKNTSRRTEHEIRIVSSLQ